jgi:aspartate racemase
MRTIGLLGGMSWESTVTYYRILNRETARRLGGLHSAPIVLYSVDFAPIERLQHDGRWDELGRIMVEAADRLRRAGAELLVICTNTMHKLAPVVESQVPLPLVHIADAAAASIRDAGLARVGLLGTRFTMEQDFYRGRLEQRGLTVLTPDDDDRAEVHRVIYEELCRGVVRDESRRTYRRIVESLVGRPTSACRCSTRRACTRSRRWTGLSNRHDRSYRTDRLSRGILRLLARRAGMSGRALP